MTSNAIEPTSDNAHTSENIMMSEHTALINNAEPGFQQTMEILFQEHIRPSLTELIATAIFVFIGTTAACSLPSVEGVALAHGFSIALLIIGTGSISGAHINPAVTLGIWIGGAIAPIQAILYVVSQLLGAILGAAFSLAVIGYSAYGKCNGGGHILPQTTEPGQAVFCEILLTALLVSIVLLAAVDPSTKSDLAPLAIGFAVTVDILAGAVVSGASMNPARSFGPAVVVNKTHVWSYHYIYWEGPAIGAVIAGCIYRLLLAGPEKRIRLHAIFSRN